MRSALLGVAAAVCACRGSVAPDTSPGIAPVAAADSARQEIETSLFLIGDAGNPARRGEPVLLALGRAVAEDPARSVVIYLGDNLYPEGLPPQSAPQRAEAERRLNAQIDVLLGPRRGARGIFLPGNHDWRGRNGWESIRRQGRYIAARGAPTVSLLPAEGCPGPVTLDVGERLRLVILDTQWWLESGPKPRDPTSDCPTDSIEEIADSLGAAVAGAGDRHVIVAAHHPLATGGVHGGNFGLLHHIFPLRELKSLLWLPLPFLGSAYPISRMSGITEQDMSGSANRRMRATIESALAERPPLAYVSGHEHNLQVLRGGAAKYLLVSGAGFYGHVSAVRRNAATLFAREASGYMRLDFFKDGRARLGVATVDRSGLGTERFSLWLEATR